MADNQLTSDEQETREALRREQVLSTGPPQETIQSHTLPLLPIPQSNSNVSENQRENSTTPRTNSAPQRENFEHERESSNNIQVPSSTESPSRSNNNNNQRTSSTHRQQRVLFDPGDGAASKWQANNVARMAEIIEKGT